jgi:protein-tyrosine phosphatase
MIDLHAHVLPGLDDGPPTWEESLLMCRQAAEDGITTLVATPHITPGVYANGRDGIAAVAGELEGRLRQAGIPLRIVPAAEIRLDADLLLDGDGIVPYLGRDDRQRFVLLHVPPRIELDPACDLVYALASRGVTAILAHPERSRQLQEQPDALRELLDAGALSQITAASLIGKFGRSSAAAARQFLDLGLVHAIASDAHSPDHRPPLLSEGVLAAAEIVGMAQARCLVSEAPAAILAGEMPDIPEPDVEVAQSYRSLLGRLLEGADAALRRGLRARPSV